MTPTEFKSALASLGLTQAGAAVLLGVHPVSVRKWSTRFEPPRTIENFLKVLIAAQVKPEELMAVIR